MKNGFRVIDGDAHMYEPGDIWEKYVEAKFRDRAPKLTGMEGRCLHNYAPGEVFPKGRVNVFPKNAFDGHRERYGEAWANDWSLKSRLDHMDSEGVDLAVSFPTNGNYATYAECLDPELQSALCRAYNDWATDFCSDSNGRVKFVAKVSLLRVEDTLAEIERIKNRSEVTSIVLPFLKEDSPLLHDTMFDPIWAACCDAELSIGYHGGASQIRWFKAYGQQGLFPVSHALGFPVENMAALGTFIFGGVFARFPKLRVGFFEGNVGWVPWWLSRLEDHHEGRQNLLHNGHTMNERPTEIFRRNCYVSADPDEQTVNTAVNALDAENITFNTDYPHPDARFPGAVEAFLQQPISDEAKRKILWDNSIALYGERLSSVKLA